MYFLFLSFVTTDQQLEIYLWFFLFTVALVATEKTGLLTAFKRVRGPQAASGFP